MVSELDLEFHAAPLVWLPGYPVRAHQGRMATGGKHHRLRARWSAHPDECTLSTTRAAARAIRQARRKRLDRTRGPASPADETRQRNLRDHAPTPARYVSNQLLYLAKHGAASASPSASRSFGGACRARVACSFPGSPLHRRSPAIPRRRHHRPWCAAHLGSVPRSRPQTQRRCRL